MTIQPIPAGSIIEHWDDKTEKKKKDALKLNGVGGTADGGRRV